MPGTQYFHDKQKNSLNSMVNGDSIKNYNPDTKYYLEFKDTMERVQNDLNEGILLKYKMLRTKQLESLVATNCYENPKFNLNEAEVCHKFHFENDYKLNSIGSFWKDHVSKHIRDYHKCNSGLDQLQSVAEKDRAFADCHASWVKDFKQE